MIYGVEETTDSRYPETKITKFTSRKAAITWVQKGGGFAWEGGARNDIPVQQQNWHHRLRDIYEIPKGERPPTAKEQTTYFEKWRGSSRRVTSQTCIAAWVRRVGDRITVEVSK